jgi:hypothetical protein
VKRADGNEGRDVVPEKHALVHFRCVNPKHQQPAGSKSDTLTIHEGKWAFCAHDIRAKDHEWTDTGGVSLEQLRSAQRRAPQ